MYAASRPVADHPNFMEVNSLPSRALERGDCYIQDPSTTIGCQLLEAQPGEKILDACAAPGGKTGYLAQLMDNRGTIVACDRDPERIEVLKQNIERLGARIARVVRHDWTGDHVSPDIASIAPFDRVLVDAPCSNTGVVRRRVDVRWRLTPADFAHMQERQMKIMSAVLCLLKPGGVVVYSTCSLEPEENEQLVRRMLEQMSSLRLEAERSSLPFRDGFDGAYAARLVRNATTD